MGHDQTVSNTAATRDVSGSKRWEHALLFMQEIPANSPVEVKVVEIP